jgi:hypothetical protein
MDELRTNAAFIALAVLLCFAGFMIRAPKMSAGWKRKTIRALGSVLFGSLLIVSALLVLGFIIFRDPPRQHIQFPSTTGARAALLSHSETRDGAASLVTVKENSCCRRYVAYEYYGDGDDSMDETSIKWIDDHHLVIRYGLDPTGKQDCHSQIGDVQVLCEPQNE